MVAVIVIIVFLIILLTLNTLFFVISNKEIERLTAQNKELTTRVNYYIKELERRHKDVEM